MDALIVVALVSGLATAAGLVFVAQSALRRGGRLRAKGCLSLYGMRAEGELETTSAPAD